MFEFGDFSATKADLYEIADQCITRLLANDLSKADAKEWCMQRFQNLGVQNHFGIIVSLSLQDFCEW